MPSNDPQTICGLRKFYQRVLGSCFRMTLFFIFVALCILIEYPLSSNPYLTRKDLCNLAVTIIEAFTRAFHCL
jgi:hypothetical protein